MSDVFSRFDAIILNKTTCYLNYLENSYFFEFVVSDFN